MQGSEDEALRSDGARAAVVLELRRSVELLMGVMLGWPKLVAALFIAIFAGAIIGVFQIILRKGPGTPFGPYLALGAITAALGTKWLVALYDWYMSFLQSLV